MTRADFSRELRRALGASGRTQTDVARAAGVAPSLVSMWLAGNIASPDPQKVFAVERALDLPPGHLSRHLGFIPVPEHVNDEPVSFRDWLAQHGQDLKDDEQDALLAVYEVIRRRDNILSPAERADALERAERGIKQHEAKRQRQLEQARREREEREAREHGENNTNR